MIKPIRDIRHRTDSPSLSYATSVIAQKDISHFVLYEESLDLRGICDKFHEPETQSYTNPGDIGFSKFNRAFETPEEIAADQIRANPDNGMLAVRVPKAETVKPRTIKV